MERRPVVAVALAVDDDLARVRPRKPVTRPGLTVKLRSLTAAFLP
jgi:hypothetical protein